MHTNRFNIRYNPRTDTSVKELVSGRDWEVTLQSGEGITQHLAKNGEQSFTLEWKDIQKGVK